MDYKDRFSVNRRRCDCKATENDPVVINGLAITPARMLELAREGKPISEQMANSQAFFHDGYTTLDFEPDIMNRRGTGLIEAYDASRQGRNEIMKVDFSKPEMVERV